MSVSDFRDLVPIRQAREELPGRPSASTLNRWFKTGVRGVLLKTVMVGGRRFVSRDDLEDFIARTTAAADGSPMPVRSPSKRERDIQRARARACSIESGNYRQDERARVKERVMGKHDLTTGAAGHMNDALLKKAREIKGFIGQTESNDVSARYKVACGIFEVRDSAKYGTNAMELLAEFFGWSLTTVNDYATVAETWPDADKFAELAARTNRNGLPLSWAHLIALTRESDGKRRLKLVEQTLENAWTVAELKKQRQAGAGGSDTEGEDSDGDDAKGSKSSNPVENMVSGMAEKLMAAKGKWDSALPKEIQKAPADDLEGMLVALQEHRKQVIELHNATLESIDTAIEQIKERRKLEAKKAGGLQRKSRRQGSWRRRR